MIIILMLSVYPPMPFFLLSISLVCFLTIHPCCPSCPPPRLVMSCDAASPFPKPIPLPSNPFAGHCASATEAKTITVRANLGGAGGGLGARGSKRVGWGGGGLLCRLPMLLFTCPSPARPSSADLALGEVMPYTTLLKIVCHTSSRGCEWHELPQLLAELSWVLLGLCMPKMIKGTYIGDPSPPPPPVSVPVLPTVSFVLKSALVMTDCSNSSCSSAQVPQFQSPIW